MWCEGIWEFLPFLNVRRICLFSDSIEQAHQAAAHKFQQEHAKLIAGYDKLEKELQDTKQKLAQERYISGMACAVHLFV